MVVTTTNNLVVVTIPEEYKDNYTPDDFPNSMTREEMITEINHLRREVNQLLKITGLTKMRLAEWINDNIGGGQGRNYTVEG